MSFYADIYVLVETRSKKMAVEFLNYFLPVREESANEYLIPQYSDNPMYTFKKAYDVMNFLELNQDCEQSIYWRSADEDSINKHAMIFYTTDGCMIFGISRYTDESTKNEDSCLEQMKQFFKTDLGYIDYENPPVKSKKEFVEIVEKLKAN